MDRYTQGEEVVLHGKLPDNAVDARVWVWKVDGTLVIDGATLTELILGNFIYRWTPQETGCYVWQMRGYHPTTGKLHTYEGSFQYGGWVDSLLKPEHLQLLAKEETLQTHDSDIKSILQEVKSTVDANLDTPVSTRSTLSFEDLLPYLSNIDVPVSSRSTLTPADLANLDVPVSSRSTLRLADLEPYLSKLDAPISSRSTLSPSDLANLDVPVSTRATPEDIRTLTQTKIIPGPRNLEVIAKSVSNYYRGQTATLVTMVTFAGVPSTAQVTADVYDPDNQVFIDSGTMTPINDTGLYTYSFSIPQDAKIGVYKVRYKATKHIDAQQYVDSFNDDSQWLPITGTWTATGGVYKQTAVSVDAYSRWKDTASVEWQNYSFEADVKLDWAASGSTGKYIGIGVRFQNTGVFLKYYWYSYSKELRLERGSTRLAWKSFTPVNGNWYRFKIEVSGSIIKCYLDNVLQFEVVDSLVASGSPFFYAYIPSYESAYPAQFDNATINIPEQEYTEYEITDFKVEDPPSEEEIAEIKEKVRILEKIETNNWEVTDDHKFIIYDDDGITPLYIFQLSGDLKKNYKKRQRL